MEVRSIFTITVEEILLCVDGSLPGKPGNRSRDSALSIPTVKMLRQPLPLNVGFTARLIVDPG
jgi:hypothetical protein